MDPDTVIGIAIIVVSLGLVTALVIWSCKSINRIASDGFRSAREIIKGKNGDE